MVEIELLKRDGSDSLTIADDAIQSLNATLTNTGVGTFRAKLKGDRRLERRAQRQDRVNIKTDDTKFAGYLLACPHTRSDGTTQIRGKGIAKKLQEGRPSTRPITYDNVFAGDAIEDYWSRTPFGNVDVSKQESNIVVQDAVTQSADSTAEWNDIIVESDTEPFYVNNGALRAAQSVFVDEAENNIVQSANDFTDSNYSDGQGVEDLSNPGTVILRYEFDLDYTIPAGDWAVILRTESLDEAQDSNTYEIFVNNNSLGFFIDGDAGLSWTVGFEGGFDLSAGQNNLEIELDTLVEISAGFDLIGVADLRYNDNIDNETIDNTLNTSSGYLDGPALYPINNAPNARTVATETARNIASATADLVIDDTTNEQSLGLSGDGGVNFQRDDNTSTFSASFTNAGREVVTEFSLGAYDNGAQNATPRLNYLGQTIDSFETTVDLDDRIVFLGVKISKNHFENLQKLHDNSNYVWTIEHSSDSVADMPVYSFPRGEETRTLDQINENEIDESPSVEAEQFYNVIPLEGGLNGGTRPFAEVKDQNSINDIGTEISPGLLRDPTISSDIEAEFIAQALLKKAVANGDLRGTKTIPPTFAPIPGFSYPVSWLDDPTVERTLEETSVTKSTNSAQTTLDFTGRSGFAQQIDELRKQARETQDEI